MCPTANGSRPEVEKFPDAPPSIEITAPEDVPDAGLRSLDHCKYSLGVQSISADILVQYLGKNCSTAMTNVITASGSSDSESLPIDRGLNLENSRCCL
jgi:hypothetical protein